MNDFEKFLKEEEDFACHEAMLIEAENKMKWYILKKIWRVLQWHVYILHKNRFTTSYFCDKGKKVNWRWNILLGYEISPRGEYDQGGRFDLKLTVFNQDFILCLVDTGGSKGIIPWGIRG